MSYLPNQEGPLKEFGLNFATLVVASPLTYGIAAGDAAAIDLAVQDYAAKYDLAINPVTRTKAALIAKNAAKAIVIATLRGYAMAIKTNRGVDDVAKGNLGLGTWDFTKSPIPAPSTFPVLQVVAAHPFEHNLRFNDSATPESRSKPEGVSGMQLFCHVGTTPPASQLASRFQSFVTRNPVKMVFQMDDLGKTAYYCARWQTAKGLFGNWGQMISLGIS